MIATLSGVVTEKIGQQLVVETGGVGYGVAVARSDLEALPTGQEIRFYIYEVVREDAHDLYGFSEFLGRELFEQLLSVSGVGPKVALAILSIANIDQVQRAISTGDVAFLQSASGVGKRGAERIAVELRNKVIASGYHPSGSETASADAALEALESLGYSRQAAMTALAKIPTDLSDEERIKRALSEV
ncbi:MAG: Holliday junction branch migration protein RuvA [Candidatus Saccharimonadales bacterium]